MVDLFGSNASRLSPASQPGVTCNAQGAYVGVVPLLKRQRNAGGQESWSPRPISELNADLRDHYGLPVDLSGKADGLAYIAGALNRGDVFRAQLAMQQLKLPSAPARAHSNDNTRSGLRTGVIPAQEFLLGTPWAETIPQIPEGLRPLFPNPESAAPWRMPDIPDIPYDEATPGPLDVPNAYQMRRRKPNPRGTFYPTGRPENEDLNDSQEPEPGECERQWAEAYTQCANLIRSRALSIPPGGSYPLTLIQCMADRVSERCGGTSYTFRIQA
jgi:hypothetical protein